MGCWGCREGRLRVDFERFYRMFEVGAVFGELVFGAPGFEGVDVAFGEDEGDEVAVGFIGDVFGAQEHAGGGFGVEGDFGEAVDGDGAVFEHGAFGEGDPEVGVAAVVVVVALEFDEHALGGHRFGELVAFEVADVAVGELEADEIKFNESLGSGNSWSAAQNGDRGVGTGKTVVYGALHTNLSSLFLHS